MHARYRRSIGVGVPEMYWRPILAFEDLLRRNRPWFSDPQSAFGITFAEDLGVQEHAPAAEQVGVWGPAARERSEPAAPTSADKRGGTKTDAGPRHRPWSWTLLRCDAR